MPTPHHINELGCAEFLREYPSFKLRRQLTLSGPGPNRLQELGHSIASLRIQSSS